MLSARLGLAKSHNHDQFLQWYALTKSTIFSACALHKSSAHTMSPHDEDHRVPRTNEAPNGQIVIVHLEVEVIRHCLRAVHEASQACLYSGSP